MARDHRIEFYVDSVEYTALKGRARDLDVSVSSYLRRLFTEEMSQALRLPPESESPRGGGSPGEAGAEV